MEEQTRKFQWKYIISWYIMGAVPGVILVLSGSSTETLTVGEKIQAVLIIMPGTFMGFAGLGMLFDAWAVHNWKFSNIEHQSWVWHIYPIVSLFHITFSFTLGFIWALITNKFR